MQTISHDSAASGKPAAKSLWKFSILRLELLVQQWLQGSEKRVGKQVGALRGRVNAVVLNGAGNVDEVFVDHGNQGDVVLGGQVAEDLFELVDVIGAVVGRQSDACQQDLDVSGFQGGEHLAEIAARLFKRQAAQAIVAAELDDDDFGMQAQDDGQAGDSIFGGGAAGALVFNFIAVAALIEFFLQVGGVRLAALQAVTGSDAVSKADQDGVGGSAGDGCGKQYQKRNDSSEPNVHMGSVNGGEQGSGNKVENNRRFSVSPLRRIARKDSQLG